MKKTNTLKYFVLTFLTIFFVFFAFQTISAATATPRVLEAECQKGNGIMVNGKCLISNPLGINVTAQGAIGIVIRGLLGIIGVVALIFFMYGGVLWMTAAGEEKNVKKGWETMTWAALGMVLVFGSTALVSLILKVVGVEN